MMPLVIKLFRLYDFLRSWFRQIFTNLLQNIRNGTSRIAQYIANAFVRIKVEFFTISLPKFKFPKLSLPSISLPEIKPLRESPVLINGLTLVSLALIFTIGLTGAARSTPDYSSFISNKVFAVSDSMEEPQHIMAQPVELAEIETASGDPFDMASLDPQAGNEAYKVEEETLNVEGVLVPQKTTVISSSRDGKIQTVHFEDGDIFQKGDVLIEYDCDDLKAELVAIEADNNLSVKKGARGEKLFKLEIISDFERLDLQNDASKAKAQKAIVEARMENCQIRAAYDGRVVNRLANDNEYTRTDRVLMEVGSLDNLEVEFLLPSKWLRWVNIGAPVTLNLHETGREYTARVSRIHGEVDPVSQSIQITAALDRYEDPLLPGMSGDMLIDISKIRNAGVQGYLERSSE